MKRLLIGGLALATLAGGAFAFADSLSVNSNNLASGSQVVASCEGAGTVTVSYDTAYDAGLTSSAGTGGFHVTDVKLGSVAAACAGQKATVTLEKSDGTAIETVTSGPLATGTNTVTMVNAHDDAHDVQNIAVVITG